MEKDVFIEFEMLLHKGFDPIVEVRRGWILHVGKHENEQYSNSSLEKLLAPYLGPNPFMRLYNFSRVDQTVATFGGISTAIFS